MVVPSKKKQGAKRISSTSWIGSVSGDIDDFEVKVDAEQTNNNSSRVSELKNCNCLEVQSTDDSSSNNGCNVKAAARGLAAINLTNDKNDPKGPLHTLAIAETESSTATTNDASTHTNTHRSSGSTRNNNINNVNNVNNSNAIARGERLSIFTAHTTTTLVSSTYHSSDLDSFSEGVPDSELDSKSDESHLQASTDDNHDNNSEEELDSGDGEDDIKSILSSDFDSVDLDLLEEPRDSSESTAKSSLSEPMEEPKAVTLPQHEQQTKSLSLSKRIPDARWSTSPMKKVVAPSPAAEEPPSRIRVISKSARLVQAAAIMRSTSGDRIKAHQDREQEYSQSYNDKEELEKPPSVAVILEHIPDSGHKPFTLELNHDLQRNVSGLTVHSAIVRQQSYRARRRGGKRNRHADTSNETWTHEAVTNNNNHKRTIDVIPNQPLPPPPPHSETPPLPRRTLRDALPQRPSPRWSHSFSSKISKVSELSTPTMDDNKNAAATTSTTNNYYKQPTRTGSYAGSFESSWDSTVIVSPASPKSTKKLRVDGTDSSGGGPPSTPDNPTFHDAAHNITSPDIPPPPPARFGTPHSTMPPPPPPSIPPPPPGTPDSDALYSRDGRPSLVNMRALSKASTITFDSAMSTPTVKERNRKNLERLHDKMNSTMGMSSPRLTRVQSSRSNMSSKSNLSILQRRESVQRLREKLQNSFQHAISPATPRGRKTTHGDASSSIPSIPDVVPPRVTVFRDSSRSPTRQYRRTPRK